MKAISCISLFMLFVIAFASSFLETDLTGKTPDQITICLDSTCNLSFPVTCKLYDTSSTVIRQCEITQFSGICCTVDSVPYPRTYRWAINNDSTKCQGNTFFYTGGNLTINFSCNNCR